MCCCLSKIEAGFVLRWLLFFVYMIVRFICNFIVNNVMLSSPVDLCYCYLIVRTIFQSQSKIVTLTPTSFHYYINHEKLTKNSKN